MSSADKEPRVLPLLDTNRRYPIGEAERYLGISHQSVYNLIASGKLKTIKEGRRRFVPGAELARLSAVPE